MWQTLQSWVFPVSCLNCGMADVALCAACVPGSAARIGEPLGTVFVSAAGAYDGVLRRAIVAMKRGERAYLDPFGAVVAALVLPGVALVPLPTTGRRRAMRGFDQAVELARRAAAVHGSPVCEILSKRGSAQHGLGRHARLTAGGRFALRPGRSLPDAAIVVDDVWTTGATLGDGIATLRTAGIAVVGAVVLARAGAGSATSRLIGRRLPQRAELRMAQRGHGDGYHIVKETPT